LTGLNCFVSGKENDGAETKLKLRDGKSALHGAPSGAMDFVFPRHLQFVVRCR